MKRRILTASVLLIIMTILTGVLYPLIVTGVSRVVFPRQANGSLIYQHGKLLGSELIGQSFASPAYFHGRPSAAGRDGYDAAASSGSNLGPTNKVLLDEVARRADAVRSQNGLGNGAEIPSDLVTASGSGLDPQISPESAYLQVPRIAGARKLPESRVRELVDAKIEDKQLGFLGEPRINVLKLNLELDELFR